MLRRRRKSMWPWSERWHDWAIPDRWPSTPPGIRADNMHHSYEKAGLVIEGQPIPWNADAVIVQCLARLPAAAARRRAEFQLRMPGKKPVNLDFLRREEKAGQFRLFFRFPPPPQTS